MIKEIIFTIFLAIVSTTLTLIQDKITQRTGQTNPFLLVQNQKVLLSKDPLKKLYLVEYHIPFLQ